MKFSVKVRYGLQAVLELALKQASGKVQISEIAKSQKIPVRYLEQLLLILKRRGLVSSQRGKEGGYTLAKHPSEISVLEVIEVFEGKIDLGLCPKNKRKASVICETFEQAAKALNDSLSEKTIEDLVLRKRQKDRAYIYNI
ncbi:RrF2 family transcriptional regulator [Candidatus Margulisiibacteriota bacterium]